MYLIAVLLLLGLMFLPQLLTQRLLKQYSSPRPDFAGTGGEFAQHLIQRFNLKGVAVETTSLGDHYDPNRRCVRLTQDKFDGKSLTAVVVAAHEVGHAIQHSCHSGGLALRTRLAVLAAVASRAAQVALIATPLLAGINPAAARMAIIVVVIGILMSTVVSVITLPVEWDASFNKALPILREGEYLSGADLVLAKRILTVCALTYVSASLGSLLITWRWLRWLR
jgi:Zn-dependent membrane protease YugP